uniref:Membrane metalloendopeptidase like 1 n=1 Tax=Oreochromis niloticus TaxID=8128 RepID=A0A669E3A0_ORENI
AVRRNMGKSESQMDIMEKSSKPGKRRWTVAEIGLSVLLLLVSCALAGLVLLRSNPSNVCTTADCVTAAARLLQNMDESVKPCDNFYQYACGGWLERHVIPETSSRHSVFDILRDKLEIVLKGQLGEIFSVGQCGLQYFDCSFFPAGLIEQRDSHPLLKLIESIGDWPVASEDWNTTTEEAWSLEDTLATLTARFHKKVVLDMYVWTDDRDSQRHIIYVRKHFVQAQLVHDSCYTTTTDKPDVREAYLHFMVSIAKITREDRNLTQDDDRVWEEMMQVLELETDIANVSASCSRKWNCETRFRKINNDKMKNEHLLSGFNWTRFIQGVLSSVSIDVQLDEEVVVYSSPYLEKMNDVLSRHSIRTMQNYLTWQLIIDRVNSLSRRFKDARARYRKTLYGTTVEDAWWRECVRYVQSSMENAVGALYVRETFAGESKRMVSAFGPKTASNISERSLKMSLNSSETQILLCCFAMAIKEHIGYPDHILQESNQKLDQEYAHLNFSEEHYFENILENLKSEAHKSLKKLREPVDPDLWIIGAAVVNAFYSPNRNQIVFPAGILQPPFFSKHQHQALNFGGIGMVIGHEITHGFDDNGRNFDKDGNMLNWWSNYSADHFKEQSQCMVQQYGNFNWKLAGGQNISGISTLGENIADNGGVRQAYKAYLKWVEMEGEEPRLPGLDMDHKQLFFLNFAQVWCGAYRPEYASQSIKTDSHSPLEYRVLGSLQNFEAFSEAFQCQKGSPMNPELKCRVW